MFEKFDSTDWLGLFILIGGFTLYAFKIDTVVGAVISLVVGYFFGQKRKKS
jgi:hypothetical protein